MNYASDETLYNAAIIKKTRKEGSLILFPSWLEHYTDENTTDNRVTVSFNTILVPSTMNRIRGFIWWYKHLTS